MLKSVGRYLRLARRLAIAGIFSVALVAFGGCQKSALQMPARPPALVATQPALARDVPVYLDEIGKCVAREAVTIVPQVSGRITQIHFTDGSDVRPGDLLFTIDPRPFQAQLEQVQATLNQDRADLALAELKLKRGQVLRRTNTISQQDLDSQSSEADVDRAKVQSIEAAVKTARLNLEYCEIRSPIEGRTGRRLIDAGNVVIANNTPLVSIQRLDPIYADFSIAENDLSTVQQAVREGKLKAEVRLPDDPGHPRIGDLTFLDNSVAEGTGTVTLRATLANPDRRFWPGRFVKVRLLLKTLKDAVLVPAPATQISAQGPFVYVINHDSTAELRHVTLGQRQGDMVVVTNGIKPGDQVVVAGQMQVIPGARVRMAAAGPTGSVVRQ